MSSPPRTVCSAAALTALLWLPCAAQSGPPGQTATARALLAAVGAERAFIAGLEQSIPSQKAATPQLPAVFWDRMLLRAKAAAPSFLDSLAPMYAAQFSEPELQALLQFFQSGVGQRYAGAQVALSQGSQALGMRWGARLGAEIVKELVDEGVSFE